MAVPSSLFPRELSVGQVRHQTRPDGGREREKKVHLGKGKFRNDTNEDIGYPACLRTIDVMEMSEAVTTGT